MKYRFQLIGVPTEFSIKEIDCNDDISITQILKNIHREYRILSLTELELIYNNQILEPNLCLKDYKIQKMELISIQIKRDKDSYLSK